MVLTCSSGWEFVRIATRQEFRLLLLACVVFAHKNVFLIVSSSPSSFPFTAEFVINLAEKHTAFDAFKVALVKNGAEFTVSNC